MLAINWVSSLAVTCGLRNVAKYQYLLNVVIPSLTKHKTGEERTQKSTPAMSCGSQKLIYKAGAEQIEKSV